jgi:CBS domain-containing protein
MRHPKRAITRDVRTRKPLHPGREAEELDALTWPETAMRVRDCMTRGVVTVHPDTLVRGAAEMMRTRRLRHLPVVDRAGRLVGIVTDRDLRQFIFDPLVQARLVRGPASLEALTIRDVMTWGVITVAPEMEIREAARRLHEQKIGALPVVDRDRLVGILTEHDVLAAFEKILGEGIVARPYRWAFGDRAGRAATPRAARAAPRATVSPLPAARRRGPARELPVLGPRSKPTHVRAWKGARGGPAQDDNGPGGDPWQNEGRHD